MTGKNLLSRAFLVMVVVCCLIVIVLGTLQNPNILLVGLLCGLLGYAGTVLLGTRREGFIHVANEKIATLGGILAILISGEIQGVNHLGTLAAGFAACSTCFLLLVASRRSPSVSASNPS